MSNAAHPYEPLTSEDAALVLVDHQVGLMSGVRDYSIAELKHNVIGLAKAAKALKLPTVATTTARDSMWGPTFPELIEALPSPTSCSLSDISGWRAGVLYPLAGGGRESGAAQLGRRDACSTCSGRRSGCWPQMVRSPAAPIPFWCYSGSGRRWSSGDRSEPRCGRCGGTGSTLPTPLVESRVDYSVKLIRSHFPRAREGRPSDVGQQSDPRSGPTRSRRLRRCGC